MIQQTCSLKAKCFLFEILLPLNSGYVLGEQKKYLVHSIQTPIDLQLRFAKTRRAKRKVTGPF